MEPKSALRPTKKQQELLEYISTFIAEHGYSPSYREIMRGCNYTSVATVALHINSLIARGHLVKRGRSARSLEVLNVQIEEPELPDASSVTASQEKWIVQLVDARFKEIEEVGHPTQKDIDTLYVLVGALKVLELEGPANSFLPRLSVLVEKGPK